MAKFYEVNPALTKDVDLKEHKATYPVGQPAPRPFTTGSQVSRRSSEGFKSKLFERNAAAFHGLPFD